MFLMKTDLAFGPDAPASLRDGFAELVTVFGSCPGGGDVETRTEVGWSALHGLATLERGGRLRPAHREQRLAVLVDQWTSAGAQER